MQLSLNNTTTKSSTNKTINKTTVDVYFTKDYDIFKTIKGNRPLYAAHVNRLITSISRQDLLKDNPIIVNEKMEVIDGQHRLEAARKLGIDIYYIIREASNYETMLLLNTYEKVWTINDYLESYISLGNPDYLEVKEYSQNNGITPINSCYLLTNEFVNYKSAKMNYRFKSGNFKVTDREYAAKMAKIIDDVSPFYDAGVTRDRLAIWALCKLEEKGVDWNRLIEGLKLSGTRLYRRMSLGSYIFDLESVYNYNKKIKERFM